MNNNLQNVTAIEELQQQQKDACNQCRALLAILDEGKIPPSGMATDFVQVVLRLREKEDALIASLKEFFPGLAAGTQAISAYRELLEQREKLRKQVDFRGVLERFCRIMSDEKSSDDAFAPFREEAARLLRTQDELTAASIEEKTAEFRAALDYLAAGDDKKTSLLDRISSGLFASSGIIVAGFALGKYYLSDTAGNLKDIEQTTRDTTMTESMVDIISDINSKFSINQFCDQMADGETEYPKKNELAGHMVSILACATWLLYFTARDFFRLENILFHDDIADGYQEPDSASRLERLVKHGYLSSFRIPKDERAWYTLALNTRLAFTDGTIQKFIRKHKVKSPTAAPDITGLICKPSQVKINDVITTAEINHSFLDALDYVNNRFNSKTVLKNILDPLCRNSQCYYVEQGRIILLSSTILEQIDESSLLQFLQRKKEFRIVVTDTDNVKALARRFNMVPCRLISLKEFGDELTKVTEPEGDSCPPVSTGVINTDENIPKPDDDKNNAPNLKASPASTVEEETVSTIETLAMDIANLNVIDHVKCKQLLSLLVKAPYDPAVEAPNRSIQALTLLYALLSIENMALIYNDLFKKLRLALGLYRFGGKVISRDSVTLTETFPDDDFIELKFPSFLLAMFSHDFEHDFALYDQRELLNREQTNQKYRDYLDSHSNRLGELISTLADLKSTINGFSPAVLGQFSDQTTRKVREAEFAKRAKVLKHGPNLEKIHFRGLPEFKERCFGKNSDIAQALEVIEQKRNEDKDLVRIIHDHLGSNNKIDNLNLESFIDSKWKEARGDARKLGMDARRQTENYIHKQFDLMDEWLNFVSDSAETGNSETLSKVRDRLLRILPEIIIDIQQNKAPGSAVLLIALEYIREALETGLVPETRYRMTELLRSCWIDLDEEYMPVFNEHGNAVLGLESWRLVMRHIAESSLQPFKLIPARIVKKEDESYYENIGTGFLIENLPAKLSGLAVEDRRCYEYWERNKIRIEKNAENDEDEFKQALELAFAYGRIEEHEKETLLSHTEALREHFFRLRNFGRFRYALGALQEEVKRQDERIGARLRDRLRRSLENLNERDRGCELVLKIQELLNSANYAVAEEYINRLDQGKRTAPDDESGEAESDYFAGFLTQERKLADICRTKRGEALKGWAPDALKFDPAWQSGQIEDARQLLRDWPVRVTSISNAVLKDLFEKLGFENASVEEGNHQANNYRTFKLHVRPAERNLPDYPHPIAKFGTQMDETLNVVCLFGNRSVHDLLALMNTELHFGTHAIVLYDNTLELQGRRELAAEFFKTTRINGFILIDRILVLYLSMVDKSKRLSALLQCALPYSFYQPFNPGKGVIPDEMFFGRRKELLNILDPSGANIVYGGRQLGKTALLLRAKSLRHHPNRERKEFAVYVDVKDKKADEVLGIVIGRLKSDARISLPLSTLSWDDFCRFIKKSFDNQEIRNLLLLIDEADVFLAEETDLGFPVLKILFDLKRETGNRFKFVFAGLHNVGRSKKAIENNGIFPQMADPLCVRPLSPADGRNLLKWPLSYLGFRLDDLRRMDLILANTNYYPGVLHFFGHRLIESIAEDYSRYYSTNRNPPYDLGDEQLQKIFSDGRLNDELREKITITLALDERYKILANLIALLDYQAKGDDKTDTSLGYSTAEIVKTATDFEIAKIKKMEMNDITTLLSEMADMGILWEDRERSRFRLRRLNMLRTIGSNEEVENFILEASDAGKDGEE